MKNGYPDDVEIEITREIIKLFNLKNGEELTIFYLKSDVTVKADTSRTLIKYQLVFLESPLYFV